MSGSLRDRWGSRRRSTNIIDLRASNNYHLTLQWERSPEGTAALIDNEAPAAILLTDGTVMDFSVIKASNNIFLYVEVANPTDLTDGAPTPTPAQARYIRTLADVMKRQGGIITVEPPYDEIDTNLVQMFQSFLNKK